MSSHIFLYFDSGRNQVANPPKLSVQKIIYTYKK
jgi:hypothetical protein